MFNDSKDTIIQMQASEIKSLKARLARYESVKLNQDEKTYEEINTEFKNAIGMS